MKTYNFDELIVREGSGSLKWDKHVAKGEKSLLPLWVADMDFACCDKIQEALHTVVDQQIYGYSMGLDDAYRASVCGWFERRMQWTIDPKTIFYAPGVVPAISYLLAILSEEGDGIVVQTPVYYPFMAKIKAGKRVVVENPLQYRDGQYRMDFEHLESCLARADVKGMILCSPHNPVGRVWTAEELTRVIEIAKRYGKWIISDEIHCDIVRKDQRHIPIHTLTEEYQDEIIVCTAPSKSFNLAGLQVSNIIITKPHYQRLWKQYVMNTLSITSPNIFALAATKAAYTQGEAWLDQMNAYVSENIRFAQDYLRVHLPYAIVAPCEGTYLMWVDLRAYCSDCHKLEELMLEESIVLDEGYIFGSKGEGFERINVAAPRSIVAECLQRMCSILKKQKIGD